jgi:hypothetical protein
MDHQMRNEEFLKTLDNLTMRPYLLIGLSSELSIHQNIVRLFSCLRFCDEQPAPDAARSPYRFVVVNRFKKLGGAVRQLRASLDNLIAI